MTPANTHSHSFEASANRRRWRSVALEQRPGRLAKTVQRRKDRRDPGGSKGCHGSWQLPIGRIQHLQGIPGQIVPTTLDGLILPRMSPVSPQERCCTSGNCR